MSYCDKEYWSKMSPIIKEWVENEDAILTFDGLPCSAATFSKVGKYKVINQKKTILVNGIEVPAPEIKKPAYRTDYFVPDLSEHDSDFITEFRWINDETDNDYLEDGLVYLNKEDAIERAKAMMLYKKN